MLILRESQIAVLERAALEQFGRRVVREIRRDHAELFDAMPEPRVAAWLKLALDRSQRYGITVRRDLRTYVTLCFVIGPCFDEYPLFQDWLTCEAVPMSRRLDLILDRASAEDWARAARQPGSGDAEAPENHEDGTC